MGTRSLFVTQVYHSRCLKIDSDLYRAIKKEVRQIEAADTDGHSWSSTNYPNGFTSYGSWDRLHLISPHFADLRKKIDLHVARYIKDLHLDISPKSLEMSRFWVNIMKKNTIHTMHIHPLSVISGTVYIEAPKGCAGIKFEDPRHTQFMARPDVKNTAPLSHKSFVEFHPKPGDVMLFESWIRHEVPLSRVDKDRISVSFNYDWVGE